MLLRRLSVKQKNMIVGNILSIENRIINGGFETSSFPPWSAFNATISTQFSHSGFYSARLLGGSVNSYIFQYVEANPAERFEFLVSLAKAGTLSGPPITLSVAYYNASFSFLGYGLITNIPSSRLPNVEDETWLEVYETTSPAPLGTTQALVLINKL